MINLFFIVFFGLGLIIGSFLNVVIFRMNTHKTLGGRSACMSCKHELSWYELIPVFSYLFLGGRCKKCKNKISVQYPVVELLSGVIFSLLFLKYKSYLSESLPIFLISFFYYAVAFSTLLVVAVYDLKHKIIPDKFSIGLGIWGFAGIFLFENSVFMPHAPVLSQILSGIYLALPFFLFWLISHGTWMGLGDAKLALGLGWLLGISRGFSGMVVSFWSGAIIGIILVLFSRKHGMKTEIPFAPYLVFGSLLAFLFNLHLF